MKKYIFTESQIKKVIDRVVTEQEVKPVSKFPFAFDNGKTTFEGEIKNGFLYIRLESDYKGKRIFKVGPVSSSKMTKGQVTITKKNGAESVMIGNTPVTFQDGFKVVAVG